MCLRVCVRPRSYVLRETVQMFREQRLESVTAFEYDHFSIVALNSHGNWGARAPPARLLAHTSAH